MVLQMESLPILFNVDISYKCLISSRCFLVAYTSHDIARILKTKKKLSVDITIHCVNLFYDDFITYKQSDELNICNQIKYDSCRSNNFNFYHL